MINNASSRNTKQIRHNFVVVLCFNSAALFMFLFLCVVLAINVEIDIVIKLLISPAFISHLLSYKRPRFSLLTITWFNFLVSSKTFTLIRNYRFPIYNDCLASRITISNSLTMLPFFSVIISPPPINHFVGL